MGKRASNSQENRVVRSLDELLKYDEFREKILPALENDLRAGMEPAELFKKYKSVAAARLISAVALEIDTAKALAAARDILDRADGKAKESKTVEHRLAALPDDELEALIKSEMASLEDD